MENYARMDFNPSNRDALLRLFAEGPGGDARVPLHPIRNTAPPQQLVETVNPHTLHAPIDDTQWRKALSAAVRAAAPAPP